MLESRFNFRQITPGQKKNNNKKVNKVKIGFWPKHCQITLKIEKSKYKKSLCNFSEYIIKLVEIYFICLQMVFPYGKNI